MKDLQSYLQIPTTSTHFLDTAEYLQYVPSPEQVSSFTAGPSNYKVASGNFTGILQNSAVALALGSQGPVGIDASGPGLGQGTIARAIARPSTNETFFVGQNNQQFTLLPAGPQALVAPAAHPVKFAASGPLSTTSMSAQRSIGTDRFLAQPIGRAANKPAAHSLKHAAMDEIMKSF